MNTKMCRKCGEIKSVTEFHKAVSSRDHLHSYCKQCAITGAKKAYHDLNQKTWMMDQSNDRQTGLLRLLDDIKHKTGCIICGEHCTTCLVFHHINPKEKVECLSKLAGTKNVVRVIIEINKCVVLCSNCNLKFQAGLVNFD